MGPAHRRSAVPYAVPPPPARHLTAAPDTAMPGPAAPGRAEAWALVAPYRGRLVAAARAAGLALPDAQDVAHHVLCRAVELGRCLDPERVEAWLLKAAVARAREVREEAAREEAVYARTRADDRLVADLDDTVCDRAHAQWLLGRLPARERRVLALSVAGETVTGIAARTGLSYPTVDRLLSRARKELRRIGSGSAFVVGFVWRHRRVAAPPAATAAVALGVTVLSLHTAVPPAARPHTRPAIGVEREVARPAAVAPVRVAVARVAPTGAAAPPAAAAPAAAEPAVPAAEPYERPVAPAAPLADAPVVARTGDEDVLTRLRKCVENGIAVRTGTTAGVVCEDERLVRSALAADPLLCIPVRRHEVLHLGTRPFEVCVLVPGR